MLKDIPYTKWNEFPDASFYVGLTQDEIDFVNSPVDNLSNHLGCAHIDEESKYNNPDIQYMYKTRKDKIINDCDLREQIEYIQEHLD